MKEFYFVRHGQTDYNILEGKDKGDHPHDIPLNQTGRLQAQAIEPHVALLPIQTICASPMTRVQETKAIIAARLAAPHHTIENFSECSAKIWKELVQHGMYNPLPLQGDAKPFAERVKRGLELALALTAPTLIVAHGGVHWALCSLLNIDTHPWAIENCGLVHFTIRQNKWTATRLA